ncbi:MAG: hemolysin family protein [Lachnospiraceae bacterium]|nr:hemolysin family protein [Lachnospiraceae bacterium]
MTEYIQLGFLFILLLLSAFFSSAETALTAVNKLKIRSLAEDNNSRAKKVLKLVENPSKMLSAILIGNNIVNLSASSLATTYTISLCNRLQLGNDSSVAIGIATGILTLLILIFGEITPKSLSTMYAEKISLRYASIVYMLTIALTPVIFVINNISFLLLKIFRIDITRTPTIITENELRTFVNASRDEGVIESEEHQMITNVVDFGDSYAKDVMIPHIDVEFANVTNTYDEIFALFEEEKYSRLPVFDEPKENIVGILNLKDVFFYSGSKEDFRVEDVMREPYFTFEYQKTSQLLIELRKSSSPVAIVLDEYGFTAGLVTLEDLLEEIVGEIRDEYDEDEEDDVQQLSETEFLADGATRLEDINDMTGLNLESDEYDSIAGHIISLLAHLPREGESVTSDHVTFTVNTMDKNRVDTVLIQLHKPNHRS